MTATPVAAGELTTAHVSGLSVHPQNRKRFGDMKEFTADVVANGVEVPLVVRPHPTAKDMLQILAGARRWLAAREAGLESVPVIVTQMNDDDARMFLIRENLHRENVHPLDEALYFKQLLDGGAMIEDLGAELGKPLIYIHKRLALTELIDPLLKLYEAEKIGHAVAMELTRLTPAIQKEAHAWIKDRVHYQDYVAKTEVKRWILQNTVLTLSTAPFSTLDAELWPAAGPCTTCPKRTGNVPSLFGDLTTKDSCTDRKCWEQKAQKHIERQTKKWDDAGDRWTPLSRSGYSEGKKFQGRHILDRWSAASKKTDKDGEHGIVVTGNLEDIGHTFWFVIRKSLGVRRTPQQMAAEKRAVRQGKVKKETRVLLFHELRTRNPTELKDLQFLALHIFDGLWYDAQKIIARGLGWAIEDQKNYSGWTRIKTAEKRIALMGKADVMRFLHGCALVKSIEQYHNGPDALTLRAKALGVKIDPFKKKAEAKFPPVKLAKKKATQTKRKAKRNARSKKQ